MTAIIIHSGVYDYRVCRSKEEALTGNHKCLCNIDMKIVTRGKRFVMYACKVCNTKMRKDFPHDL